MQQPEEGVIKFICEHIVADPLPGAQLSELKHFRQLLYMQKLIGADENGIGYGNISRRFNHTSQFIISGTQTGHLEELSNYEFTLVNSYDIGNNWLQCTGPVIASSESLSHAALYSVSKEINAVIHVHHNAAWQKLLNKIPKTPEHIPYGSPQMADAISALHNSEDNVIIMGGHFGGIISYGENLEHAFNSLIKVLC